MAGICDLVFQSHIEGDMHCSNMCSLSHVPHGESIPGSQGGILQAKAAQALTFRK